MLYLSHYYDTLPTILAQNKSIKISIDITISENTSFIRLNYNLITDSSIIMCQHYNFENKQKKKFEKVVLGFN